MSSITNAIIILGTLPFIVLPGIIIALMIARRNDLKWQKKEQDYFDEIYKDLENHLKEDLKDSED